MPLANRTNNEVITPTQTPIFKVCITHLNFLDLCVVVNPGVDHLLHEVDKKEPGQHGHLRHWVGRLMDETYVHGVLEVGLCLREQVKKHNREEDPGAETQTHREASLRTGR